MFAAFRSCFWPFKVSNCSFLLFSVVLNEIHLKPIESSQLDSVMRLGRPFATSPTGLIMSWWSQFSTLLARNTTQLIYLHSKSGQCSFPGGVCGFPTCNFSWTGTLAFPRKWRKKEGNYSSELYGYKPYIRICSMCRWQIFIWSGWCCGLVQAFVK